MANTQDLQVMSPTTGSAVVGNPNMGTVQASSSNDIMDISPLGKAGGNPAPSPSKAIIKDENDRLKRELFAQGEKFLTIAMRDEFEESLKIVFCLRNISRWDLLETFTYVREIELLRED